MPEDVIFNEWDIKEADKQLAAKVDPVVKTNKKFISGDHWQNQEGYIGPRPSVSDAGRDIVMDLIKQGFVSRNVIREITRRHKNGVAGIEPRWDFTLRVQPDTVDTTTPPDQSQNKELRELTDALTEWWDTQKVHQSIKDAAEMSLWGRRGIVRLYIPVGLLPGKGLPNPSSLASALRYIFVEALDAETAAEVEDPDTKVKAMVMVTEETLLNGQTKKIGEIVYPAEPFLDPEKPPLTNIRALGDDADPQPFPMDLGGRLTMFEINRDLMITEQIQQAQRALNLDLTIMPRNIIQGGFLERVFLAAQMPGHWEKDDKGNNVKWIPEPYETGAATTNWVQGTTVEDEATGKTAQTQPDVRWREPTDVQFAINAKNAHYRDMLEECDQADVLIVGDATPSGRSRQEARADFTGSLRETQTPTTDAGRWLLETVTAMAEFLMSSPGKWTKKYRAEFECLLDAGPPDSTDQQAAQQLYDDGITSEETTMSRVGIVDVVAERTRRNMEGNFARKKKQFEALAEAVAVPGVGLDGAAEHLGFTTKEVTLIKKGAVNPASVVPSPGTQTQLLKPTNNDQNPGGRRPLPPAINVPARTARTNGPTPSKAQP